MKRFSNNIYELLTDVFIILHSQFLNLFLNFYVSIDKNISHFCMFIYLSEICTSIGYL